MLVLVVAEQHRPAQPRQGLTFSNHLQKRRAALKQSGLAELPATTLLIGRRCRCTRSCALVRRNLPSAARPIPMPCLRQRPADSDHPDRWRYQRTQRPAAVCPAARRPQPWRLAADPRAAGRGDLARLQRPRRCPDGDRRADGAGAAELERAAARLEQLDRMTPAAGGQHLQLQRLTRLM